MAFKPRTNELTGKACCEQTLPDGRSKLPSLPCPKCLAHFGRTPRAAAAHPYESPDPYAAGILRLQQADAKAAAERTHTPTPRPTELHLDANGIPDPYFHDLERMRSTNR